MSSTNRGLTLVLASTSRYRRELLERLRIPFETVSPDIDEAPLPGETPAVTAGRLAIAKGQAVRGRYAHSLIIGSDQVAFCEGVRLDKPGNHDNAVMQLRHCSDKSVNFITAVALINSATERTQTRLVGTEVRFRKLSADVIERYLRAEPAYDCAGSAKAEGLGIALMEEIRTADPTALIGLPLIALTEMLRNEDFPVP